MPIPYDGEIVTLFNPDGTEVPVRAWGNQFAAVVESLDGFTLVEDPETGFFHYATQPPPPSTARSPNARAAPPPPTSAPDSTGSATG